MLPRCCGPAFICSTPHIKRLADRLLVRRHDCHLLVLASSCHISPWVWVGPGTGFWPIEWGKECTCSIGVITLRSITVPVFLTPRWLWRSELPCCGLAHMARSRGRPLRAEEAARRQLIRHQSLSITAGRKWTLPPKKQTAFQWGPRRWLTHLL